MFRLIFALLRLQILRAILKKASQHPKLKQHAALLGPVFVLLEWFFTRRSLKKR
ncbi:hypothetical protein Lnau_1307 [Legionella nautarum]|uniref:Uncharacterized protein n=1 Tax=Legionella nautarum TaxID=45070 RepID=A0A0W0WVI5_9GAMM|nr:hypothetical protein [Legionella nautarum]KTD36323.1 hypothetical protein Lnau_1307 [Legionella nautarum]